MIFRSFIYVTVDRVSQYLELRYTPFIDHFLMMQ